MKHPKFPWFPPRTISQHVAEYLAKHRLKNELGSFDRVIDFYFTQDRPTYDEFHKAVEDTVDIEKAYRAAVSMFF